jgi:L-seryl-tRNA(Ser) seleniumtransferase
VGDLLARLESEPLLAALPVLLCQAWIRESIEEARAMVRAAMVAAKDAGASGSGAPAPGPSGIPMSSQARTAAEGGEAAGSQAAPVGRDRAAWIDWCAQYVLARAAEQSGAGVRRVVNATGVLLHTNLGRAPLPASAQRALFEAAGGYSNLEMDLQSGRRCSRLDPLRRLLPLVTGAEAGIAVHNNAAAVHLALTALAAGREVIVSRGHLVEIGGSFRLPEIMAASGARLREVGSTNRTRLSDYESALSTDTALVLKVHPSNFRLIGFTEEVPTQDLAVLAHRHGVPLLHDVGSGALRAHGELAFGEPTVQEALEAGADVVCFSGDKLLGGPQAGILVGRREWIERLSKHPLARVVRLDKVALAALAGTLEAWLDPGTVRTRIPLLALLARGEAELEAMARSLAERLRAVLPAPWVIDTVLARCEVGGGTLPGLEIPSRAVRLAHAGHGADAVARALRLADPAVAGRIEDDRVLLDVRALLPGDEERIGSAAAALPGARELPCARELPGTEGTVP